MRAHRDPGPTASPAGIEATLLLRPLRDRMGWSAVGEVSLGTRRIWESGLENLTRRDDAVYHLELAAVTFVDVAGAWALAVTARGLTDGRRIVLHRPPQVLRRTLRLFWPDTPAIEVAAS